MQVPQRINSGYKRAQYLFPVEMCAVCNATTRLQRHHRDKDPTNNVPENIEVLCVKCHTATHRLERHRRGPTPRPCAICGTVTKLGAQGYMKTCSPECAAEAVRRGLEKRWAGKVAPKEIPCDNCGELFARKRPRDRTCSRSCGNKLAWSRRP